LAEHNILGDKGEQIAVEYLLRQGYTVLATNWRFRKYELDIVAQKNNELVIVEVKTRATDFFGNPEDAVTPAKQKHLVNGANSYIETNEIDLDCRFDVIAIILNKNQQEINHFKAAFYPELD